MGAQWSSFLIPTAHAIVREAGHAKSATVTDLRQALEQMSAQDLTSELSEVIQ